MSSLTHKNAFLPSNFSDSSSVSNESATSYRGKLNLQIYVNSGLLTIYVIAARHLRLPNEIPCDSYVKVALVPDEQNRARCKTQIAYNTTQPEYNEKFSFELFDEDCSKRVFISVWHRDSNRKQCEFLGCMSFGIRNIYRQEKVVDGWYYLLPGQLGRSKHLKALADTCEVKLDDDEMNSDTLSSGFSLQEPRVVIMKKNGGGFGFTMSGSQPVKICRLEPGGAAELAGLQCGDYITRIDGVDVSQLDLDRVANIIKSTQKQIVLEVRNSLPQDVSLLQRTGSAVPRFPICNSTPYQEQKLHLDEMSISPWDQRNNPQSVFYGWLEEKPTRMETKFARKAFSNRNDASFSPYATMPRSSRSKIKPPSSKNYGWLDGDKENNQVQFHDFL